MREGKVVLIAREAREQGLKFGIDAVTPKVTWSVKVGKKSSAFAGTLAIKAGEDEKDKNKNKETEKDAGAPKE